MIVSKGNGPWKKGSGNHVSTKQTVLNITQCTIEIASCNKITLNNAAKITNPESMDEMRYFGNERSKIERRKRYKYTKRPSTVLLKVIYRIFEINYF